MPTHIAHYHYNFPFTIRMHAMHMQRRCMVRLYPRHNSICEDNSLKYEFMMRNAYTKEPYREERERKKKKR